MEKVLQIVIRGDNPVEIEEFIDSKLKNLDVPEGASINLTDMHKKLRYTSEDDKMFALGVHVRVSCNSSVEFLAGFNTMFAYYRKTRESEDKKWLMFDLEGVSPSTVDSHLSRLKVFIERMNGLRYEGTLEVKVEPYVPLYSTDKNLTVEDIYQMMLDRHLKIVDWTNINNFEHHS